MNKSPAEYARDKGLDPDVFFTGEGGPISPQMRTDWISTHEGALDHPGIEYDNDTGFYHYRYRVPDEVEDHYRENRAKIREKFADKGSSVVFTNAGIFIVGSVQTPGTAVLLSKMVEQMPQMYAASPEA